MPTPTLTQAQLLGLLDESSIDSGLKIAVKQLVANAAPPNATTAKVLMVKITTPVDGAPSFVDAGINTLGNTNPLVWSRIGVGTYKLTSVGAFTGNIMPRFCLSMGESFLFPGTTDPVQAETRYKVTKISNDELLVENTNNSFPTDFSDVIPIVFEVIMY